MATITVPRPAFSTPVVIVPATTPFPAVTIYSSTGHLIYSNPADSSTPETWREIIPSEAAPVTVPHVPFSLNFWWLGGSATLIAVFQLRNGMLIGDGEVLSTEYAFNQSIPTAGSTNVIATTVFETVTAPVTATNPPYPTAVVSNKTHRLSGGATAGIVVGILAGITLVVGVVWYTRLGSQKKSKVGTEGDDQASPIEHSDPPMIESREINKIREMLAPHGRSELQGKPVIAEAEGSPAPVFEMGA